MGMIHGTFIIADNSQQSKGNQPLNLPAAKPDKPVEENEQQRLIRELKEKWQQILAFVQGIANN